MEKEANFRVQAHRIHLTYKTHIEEVRWRKWAEAKFSEIKSYSIVHENGDENNNYPHTHILVDFVEKLNIRNCHAFDYKLEENNEYWTNPYWKEYHYNKEGINSNEDIRGIHPNIKTVGKDIKYWNTIVEYHKKKPVALFTNIESDEEKKIKEEAEKKANCKKCLKIKHAKKHTCGMIEYEEEKEEKGIEYYHSKYSSISEAIQGEHKNNLKGIHNTITAMKYKPIDYGPEPKVKWRPWQEKLYNETKEECYDDRTIIWVYDEKGNGGKTAYSKHMAMWHKAFISTHANPYHIGTTIQNRFAIGDPINTVIINLVREQCDNKIYSGIELIKDGLITSQKFNGETIIFNSPHVIIFANFKPEESKLSADRWDIREITEDGKDFKVTIESSLKKPKVKPVLEEGYSLPGRIITVAKPDKIRTKEEIEEDENECDGNSSVSSPGRRSLSECSFENERPLIQNRVDNLLKICSKNDLPRLQ